MLLIDFFSSINPSVHYLLLHLPGYIDANSGMIIISMLVAAIAGAGMTLRLYWAKLKQKLSPN